MGTAVVAGLPLPYRFQVPTSQVDECSGILSMNSND